MIKITGKLYFKYGYMDMLTRGSDYSMIYLDYLIKNTMVDIPGAPDKGEDAAHEGMQLSALRAVGGKAFRIQASNGDEFDVFSIEVGTKLMLCPKITEELPADGETFGWDTNMCRFGVTQIIQTSENSYTVVLDGDGGVVTFSVIAGQVQKFSVKTRMPFGEPGQAWVPSTREVTSFSDPRLKKLLSPRKS